MKTDGPIGLNPFSSPTACKTVVEEMRTKSEDRYDKLGYIEDQLTGTPPFNEEELREAGFAEMTNINFRGAKQRCVRASSKLVDLIASPTDAVRVKLRKVPEAYLSLLPKLESDAARVFTDLLRSGPVMQVRVQRIWECVTKGVGFAFFRDADCPVPEFLPRSAIIVPPNASADVRKWRVCAVKFSYTAAEVFKILDTTPDEGGDGWNRRELKLAFAAAEGQTKENREFTLEKAEACVQARRNGVWDQDFSLNLYHVFVRNADGKVEEYVVAEDFDNSKFLFRSKSDQMYECFTKFLFPLRYSKFESAYWNVDGLGHDLYDVESINDRTMSGLVDLADLGMRPIVTHPAGTVAGRVSSMQIDRFIHLNAGDEIKGDLLRGDTNLAVGLNRILGAHGDAMADRTGIDTAGAGGSRQPISAAEAKMDSIEYTEQHTVAAGFFYEQEQILLREIVARAMKYRESPVAEIVVEGSYPEVAEMHDALKLLPRYGDMGLKKKGGLEITVARAVGAGNQRDRRMSLQLAFQQRGALSPIGARAIVADFFRELLGEEGDRYTKGYDEDVFPTEQGHHPRYENAFFTGGTPIEVAVDDNHEFHLQLHTPFVQQIIQAGVQAEKQGGDSTRILSALQAVAPHYARHTDLFQLQANTEELAARHKFYLQVAGEATNYLQRLTKNVTMAREAQARQQMQQQAAQQKQVMEQQKMVFDAQREVAALKDDSRRKDRVASADISRKARVATADVEIKRRKASAEA